MVNRMEKTKTKRYYSELIQIPDYKDRFEYLKLLGVPCQETFGCKRYLNQQFYRSQEWLKFRNRIIIRDNGCDLAHKDYMIPQGTLIQRMPFV